MIEKLKKNKFLVIVGAIYIILFLTNTEKATLSVKNSGYYIKEMLMIMPVVFLLTSLLEAWVPKKMIMEHLGEGSGFKGSFISLLLGSISAGPIYAAFPICKTLLKKGASISNIVVILSAWAVIKIPMLANEAKFLSPKFMATRWVFTTISIFLMGYIISKLVKKEDLPMENEEIEEGTIILKSEFCIGCGICEKLVPEHFFMEGNKALVINNKVTEETETKAQKIQEKCPAKAIQVG
ncbi:4Fe-4S single cluster domain of Ferredoxin I [Proteiniborus ethanoligenes]|uniref:4Fe-4S single cluster domain of Ferredoxin I n=1 Tax=Proteiniborus ethanoligenes TaxID=415015 RepID=A0A1H3P1I3_9FIRM|nr:permease [Proteiniborus ethanoligenes]SDY94938.1 4Fe-4S single cluster domain of Ferredoxin I [Proteiniborus ethanoligenes]